MNSLKTTVVCIVLIGVLYGVYQVLNGPFPNEGEGIELSELDIVTGGVDENGEAYQPGAGSSSLGVMGEGYGEYVPQPPLLSETTTPSPTGEGPVAVDVAELNSAPIAVDPNSLSPTIESPGLNGPGVNGPGVNEGDSTAIPPYNENKSPYEYTPGDYENTDAPQTTLGNSNPYSSPYDYDSSNVTTEGEIQGTPNGQLVSDRTVSEYSPNNEPYSQTPLDLSTAWDSILLQVDRGDFTGALRTLSPYYNDATVPMAKKDDVLVWLKALALKVIYSDEPNLVQHHIVQSNESLDQIAFDHQVTPNLLRNINRRQFTRSDNVLPGAELKMVNGPFRAEVNLTRNKLTIFLGEMFAGEFDIQTGVQPAPAPGRFAVQKKLGDGIYGSSANGDYQILFGGGYSIGASNPNNSGMAGCIKLNPSDAKSVYDLLISNAEINIIR